MRTLSKNFLPIALLSLALAGCGGSTASSPSTSLSVDGGATLLSKSTVSTINSSGTPTTHTFGDTDAVVPAGVSIPAGTTVAVLSSSTPILTMAGTGGFTVDGNATGVGFANGKLTANVALAPSPMSHISASAPVGGFVLGTGSKALTINGAIKIDAPVTSNGVAGIPSSISGNVPSNGSSSAGVVVHTTFPAVFASGYTAKLTISWTAGGVSQTIIQSQPIAVDGKVTFSPSAGGAIPAAGIDTLRISLVAI